MNIRPISPLLAAILLTASVAAAQMATPPSANEHTLRLFLPDMDWPPYVMNDPQYPGPGVLVEVLTAVAEPLGYSVQVLRLPDRRGWDLLESGGVDVHAKAREWVEDPDRFLWTDPFMESEDVLLFRAESRLGFAMPESLRGRSVAAIKGFLYPGLEAGFRDGRMHRIDTTSPYTMLELLAMGRVDAAVVNRSETLWLFRNRPDLQPARFRMDTTCCDSAWYRYVFPKGRGWETFIRLFNHRLDEMKQDGRLKAILDQYR